MHVREVFFFKYIFCGLTIYFIRLLFVLIEQPQNTTLTCVFCYLCGQQANVHSEMAVLQHGLSYKLVGVVCCGLDTFEQS